MKNSFKSKIILAVASFMALQGAMVSAGPLGDIVLDEAVLDIDDIIIWPLFPYDAKTFHGSECQPLYGSQSADINYYTNRVYNVGSGSRGVTCPVVRDNTTNTSGTFGTEIYVNNVAGKYLACTLYSYDSHGSWVASSTKSTTAGGKQTLYPDVNLSKNMGNYSVYCYLPKGASLYSYKVKEWLTNNTARTDWFN